MSWLQRQGVKDFVVSLCHLAEVGEEALRRWPHDGCEIKTVREIEPLGTGGALRFALATAAPTADIVLCANADSLVLCDLGAAWRAFDRPDVDGILVGLNAGDASRYGTLGLDAEGHLTAFQEKKAGPGVINAGIYFFKRAILQDWPDKTPLSLEYDLFPKWLAQGRRFWVHRVTAPFLDIGTPESLGQAELFVRTHLLRGRES